MLGNAGSSIQNINDIKFKDFSLTFEKRKIMSEKLQSINEVISKDSSKKEISKNVQQISEKLVSNEFKESFDEFVNMFNSVDSFVVNSNSKAANNLKKISELGLILIRSEKKDKYFNKVYYEYELTEIGKIVKSLYENSTNPNIV